MNPIRITLSGSLGSGKSSVGKALSRHFGVPFISTGEIFRSIGKVTNLSALQTNLEAETNTSIDEKVDGFIVEKAQTDAPFIMDSRMAWHFVPQSLKVYLYASYETAARRIQSDTSRETETYQDIAEAEQAIKKRRLSEQVRYANLYGVDIDKYANYDLMIVSDGLAIDDLVAIILAKVHQTLSSKIYLSKNRLVPMMSVGALSGSSDAAQPCPLYGLNGLLQDGYGFVYEQADRLAHILKSDGNVTCLHPPSPSGQERARILEDLKNLDPRHFQRWEAVGSQSFDIRRYLETLD